MPDPSTRAASLPASPPLEDAAKPQVYRPLSLLAMAGLGLAGLYTAIIVIGGVVAFIRGTPWLIESIWVLAILPIAAAVLSGVGLVRIQRSEATLAGEKVARWGLLLSVLVGLSYWAYYGATYVAIGREAHQVAEDFLKKLSQRDNLAAFRLTLDPASRPAEGTGLRTQLEQRFNALDEKGTPGRLSLFLQDDKVRLLNNGGLDHTTYESLGISRLVYSAGSYQVDLRYRVTTPEMIFILHVPLVSKTGTHSEGRQWEIIWGQAMMINDPSEIQSTRTTEVGQKHMATGFSGRQYLTDHWLKLVYLGQKQELYYETLLPEQRDQYRPALAVAPIGLLAGASACGCPVLTRLPCLLGISGLSDGIEVRVNNDEFWAPDDIRDKVIRAVREEVRRPSERLAAHMQPTRSSKIPLLRQEGDRLGFQYDVTLVMPLAAPLYIVEGRILMDCAAADSEHGSVKAWRVRSLELISGRTLPRPKMPPDAMRPAGP